MSSALRIGCPACETPVRASIPNGPGLKPATDDASNRLRGRGMTCENCGHELELYFY